MPKSNQDDPEIERTMRETSENEPAEGDESQNATVALPSARSASGPGESKTRQLVEDDTDSSMTMVDRTADREDDFRLGPFGHYDLQEVVGRGGMGVVYKAYDRRLKRVVALKKVLRSQLTSEADIQRFETEAQAIANCEHPGIVPIFEVGEHDGDHYFAMAYVDGQSLTSRLVSGPVPPRDAARIVEKVAEAIHHAHEREILHRDLKPSNVLIDKKHQPHLIDFGLAKRLHESANLTATGMVVGTPSYMAPERIDDRLAEIGPASDVYSLGALLYELLVRRAPFQSSSPVETMRQVLKSTPANPRRLNPDIPEELEAICMRCLEKKPGARYATAREVAEDLRRWLDHEPIVAAKPIQRMATKASSNVAVVLWLLIVALLAVTSVQIWRLSDARNEAQAARSNLKTVEAESRRAAQLAEDQQQKLQVQITAFENELKQAKIDLENSNQESIHAQEKLQQANRDLESATADYNQYRQETEQKLVQQDATIQKLQEALKKQSPDPVESLGRLTPEQRQAAAKVHEGISSLAKDQVELAARLFETASDPKYAYPRALYYHAYLLVLNAETAAELDEASKLLDDYIERAKPRDVSDVDRLRSEVKSKQAELSKSSSER